MGGVCTSCLSERGPRQLSQGKQLIAGSAVYSTVQIASLTSLKRLAALFEHESKKALTTLGHWMTTLYVTIRGHGGHMMDFWESLCAILKKSPRLQAFHMRDTFMQIGYLDPLLHTHKILITQLTMNISPFHVYLVKVISQVNSLQQLELRFVQVKREKPFAAIDTVEPLCLPLVQQFSFYQNLHLRTIGQDSVDYPVTRYIGRCRFRENCDLALTGSIDAEHFLLLNPLFEAHSSSRIDVAGLTSTGIPAGTTLFSRAQSIYFDEMPSPQLFDTTRLPSAVYLTWYLTWNRAKDTKTFLEILDVLIASPHTYDTRLHINGFKPSPFSWEPALPSAEEVGSAAEFAGILLRYIGPLLRKGIDIVDENGKGFRDHFKRVLAGP
jgi:hypothetical protein